MSLALDERFDLTRPLPLASIAPQSGAVSISGVARYGLGIAGDLCFCDRSADPDVGSLKERVLVLCSPALANAVRARCQGAIVIELPDPRAAFIDFTERLLSDGAVAVSSAIPRPFGCDPTSRIGAGSVIHPETRIEQGAIVGANCTIHRGTWIGAGAVIRDNCVIGVPGINAYRGLDGKRRRFPHLGGTIIGSEVEIGAGVIVSCGIVNSTFIGRGVVVGNLCNIGHVVDIGENVWMSVGCLVGGHVRIGESASIGMGACIRDNVDVGARAQVGMGSVVVRSIPGGASVFGSPARPVPAILAGPER